MISLIESEYVRVNLNKKDSNMKDDNKYPIFLNSLLENSEKIRVKEACCR